MYTALDVFQGRVLELSITFSMNTYFQRVVAGVRETSQLASFRREMYISG